MRLLVLLPFFLTSIACPLLSSGAERPNIVVILTDDMGYSDLGCFGSEIETPNLDALAARGIRYTQMYNTSKCWTTRISLLTGLYHQRSDRDFRNTTLIGELLQPAGYRTWWSGKHHASFNPHERGFHHFSGFLGGAINFWNPSDRARPGEPLPGWRATYEWAFDDTVVRPYLPEPGFYATDAFTDWALRWLEEERSEQEPFFLFLAYNAPHWPLHAHPKDIQKYQGVYEVGYSAIRKARYQRQVEMGLFGSGTAPLSPPDHESWEDLSPATRADEALRMQIHAAMVDSVDQNMGRLLQRLEAIGELDRTLILFLVDNGASHERPRNAKTVDQDAPWGSVGSFEAIGASWANVVNAPLRKWKVQGLEGGINTPMIAHWPKGITAPPGSICREPCHLIDLVPTFLELAGSPEVDPKAAASLDGISLLPSFEARHLKRDQPLFFQYGAWQVVREGPWKLVQQRSEPWQLFDLSRDRTELVDLSAQHPERVEALSAKWHAWYRECTGRAWTASGKKEKKKLP